MLRTLAVMTPFAQLVTCVGTVPALKLLRLALHQLVPFYLVARLIFQ